MRNRPSAFVLVAADHGSLIVNRHDWCPHPDGKSAFGVGFEVMENGHCQGDEVEIIGAILATRRRYFGDGVVLIDCGANVGTHTVPLANAMTGWGAVLAFEAQERVFYALAGNIALNNCFNAKAMLAAVGAASGEIAVPVVDYLRPGSFGSLELRQSAHNETIGQAVDYRNTQPVDVVRLDALELPRVDLIKIDVEGMEMEVLRGAYATIEHCRPVLVIEKLKTPEDKILAELAAHGYQPFGLGPNILAVHPSDPTRAFVLEIAVAPDAA